MYNESLGYDETDEEATLELANLYLTTNDYDSCQKLCRQLMMTEGKAANDAAFTMMATIMFRKKVKGLLFVKWGAGAAGVRGEVHLFLKDIS